MDPTDDMINRAIDYYVVKRDAKMTFGSTWGMAQLLRAALDGYELGLSLTEREQQVVGEVQRCTEAGEWIGTGSAIVLLDLVERAQRTLLVQPQPDASRDAAHDAVIATVGRIRGWMAGDTDRGHDLDSLLDAILKETP